MMLFPSQFLSFLLLFLSSSLTSTLYTRMSASATSSSSQSVPHQQQHRRQLVLAVDGGTESIRAGWWDATNGELVGQIGTASYPTHHPHPGWAEQDPHTWWTSLQTAVRAAVASLPDTTSLQQYEFCAMSIDTTCCSVVALNANKEPVGPCILWMDQRAAGQAMRIRSLVEQSNLLTARESLHIHGVSGPVSAEWMLPKAMWIQEHWGKDNKDDDGDDAAVVASICEYQDYLNYKLTGVFCASACNAATRWHWNGTAAVDAAPNDTSYPGRPVDLYTACGVPELVTQLPQQCLAMGTCIGNGLTETAAAALGLPPGLPVVQGGPDAFVAMLGLGCCGGDGGSSNNNINKNMCCLITGSSHLHCVVTTDATPAPGVWGPYPGAPLPGLQFAEGGQSSTGSVLRWARQSLFGNETFYSYKELDTMASAIPPGSDGLTALETFQGSRTPVTDPLARGALVGLTLSHTKAHVWRACLEAVCFGTRACIDALEGVLLVNGDDQQQKQQQQSGGSRITEVTIAGGVTRSETWLQMHADITNRVVNLCDNSEHAPLQGCAVLAAVGAGIHPSVEAACQAMVRVCRRVEPNPEVAKQYESIYQNVYRRIAPAVAPISHAIHHQLRGGATGADVAAAPSTVAGREATASNHTISPSLLACDWGAMRHEVQRCLEANLTRIHVDVFDGVFLDSPLALTFGPQMIQSIRSAATSMILDVHLCVDRPERYVEPIARAGGDSLIFQWEAVPDFESAAALVHRIHATGMKSGVSLNPSTPIGGEVVELLDTNLLDVVNVLAVEAGFGGQLFQDQVLKKIRDLYQWRKLRGLDFDIMVDGGINKERAVSSIDSGADILVTGSFLFGSNDLRRTAQKLSASSSTDTAESTP